LACSIGSPLRWSFHSSNRALRAPAAIVEPQGVELAYETVDWMPVEGGHITEAL
jgi:hypothetical protein